MKMDSRLLNAFHDDPYEASYGRYESSVEDIWSTDTIAMENMELTDTLDGILPIAATETENDICNLLFPEGSAYDNSKEAIQIRQTNALVYNDFTQQHIKADERVGTIGTDLVENEVLIGAHVDVDMEMGMTHKDDDALSECSITSFRSRTDSSSIGDYESHSSDYDDDDDDGDQSTDDEEELENDDILTDLPGLNLLSGEEFMFHASGAKQRTISTNTIGSDVDAMNFDLAEFITSDDVAPVIQQVVKPVVHIISSKFDGNDSDSDVIVDVETVEFEEGKERTLLLKNAVVQVHEDNLAYVDNVKEDPSWDPKETKTKMATKQIPKSGKPRGKGGAVIKSNTNPKFGGKKQILKVTHANVQTRAIGLGKSGKNLSLLKHDCDRSEDECSKTRTKDKDVTLIKHDSHSIDPRIKKGITPTKNFNKNSNETEKRKLNLEEYKRRYCEYSNSNNAIKSRINTTPTTPSTQSQQSQLMKPLSSVNINPQTPTKSKPHSEAVTSVVKSLKAQQNQQNVAQQTDPITLAKNKVLRMQELKRAQQMKIIDSTISAKVPRVTKLLPLQEIIKDTTYAIKNEKQTITKPECKDNPDYEKIVLVSVSCNTALSILPKDVLPNVPLLDKISQVGEHVKISNNSLITSIQNAVVKQTLPKIKHPSSMPPTELSSCKINTQTSDTQHGEDKIIMHLRKDRIREHTSRSVEVQTDFQAAFPTLSLLNAEMRKPRSSKRTKANYRKRNVTGEFLSSDRNSDTENSSSSGSESSDESDVNHATAPRTEYQKSETAGGFGGTGSVGGYSSRSSRRHRSSVSSSYSESGHRQSSRSRTRSNRNHRTSYRSRKTRKHSRSSSSSSTLSDYSDRSRSRSRSRSHSRHRTRSRSPYYRNSRARHETNNYYEDRNVSKPAVEERRIVYVGRIEEETTKEMLRRKFIAYGSIKQITIHYKETGMKYGFVTFDRSEDAFAVIDNSTRDGQINMYDISFGGRRAFCRTSYADLDNAGINTYHSYIFPNTPAPPKKEDSFEALLQKVKAKMDANKSSSSNNKL